MAAKQISFIGPILLAGVLLCSAVPSPPILEGESADSGQFPWVASVRVNNVHVAGGSIINSTFIITGARTITGKSPSSLSVRVGSTNQLSGGKIVYVKSIDEHPSFGNFMHDLSILELTEPLEFTDKISPISISKKNISEVAEGSEVLVAGWGLSSLGSQPYKLQYKTFSIISPQNCEYEVGFGYDSSVCLRHKENEGICKGDEGSGVVHNNELLGIASFAFGACGSRYPDVAVRLSYYEAWIKRILP